MACKERAAKVGGGVLGRVWALVAALALLLGLAAFAPAPAQAASFKDVPSGQWYTSWVDQASDRGLMSGFTDPATGRPTGYFGPDEPLTRAQVATVLWRMAGGPSSGHASFPDVERGSWYDAPVAWCVKAGVVTGYTSGPDKGCFRPSRPVTRQELATMVYRYAKYAGMDVADPDPTAFRSTTDWRTVDSWASEALTWTAAAGVLSGVDNHDGTYSVVPFGTATRAMAAKVFVVLSGSPSAAKASYTVTFDSNGGSAVKAQAVKNGAKASKPADPAKSGYAFKGWYSDKSLTKAFNFNSTVKSNLTLYAKWEAKATYTVTFNANGGTAVKAQSVASGAKASKPADPTKAGHAFKGWYTDKSLTEAYDFGSAVRSDLTLYAKWEANEYTVTFVSNGGTSVAKQTVSYGAKASRPSDPTLDGSQFAGWYSDAACTEAYDFGLAVESDLALYAKWEANEYTVTFVSNGGTSVSRQTVAYGAKASKPSDPTLDGNEFAGWYTDAACTEAYDFNSTVRSDLALYAKWEKKAYAVLYEDGLLSLQVGADTDPSHGGVLGKWAWDGSSNPWHDEYARVRSVVARDGVAVSNGYELFSGLENCGSMDLSRLDVSNASGLSKMFWYCSSLTSLDVSGWDVSNASDLSYMFCGCSSLTSLDVSGWDVSGASGLSGMFSNCSSLTSLDLSGWDVSGASDLSWMFFGCSSLNSLALGAGCGPLVGELPLGPWYDAEGNEYDLPPAGVVGTFTKTKPASPVAILYEDGLLSLQLGPDEDASHGEVLGKWEWDVFSRPWDDNSDRVTSIVVRDDIALGNHIVLGLFGYMPNCRSMDLSRLDVSAVTDFENMFVNCSSLESLDLSSWDVSNGTSFRNMFWLCHSLSSLDLSGWDVSNGNNFGWMFDDCSSLESLDLSGWNVSGATAFDSMFYGCSSLSSLDLSGWDVSNASALSAMFSNCSSLTSLDVSGWDVSGASGLSGMFSNCSSLTSLDLSGWDVSNAEVFNAMFSGCSALSSLNLAGWEVSKATRFNGMFYGCSSLTSLDLSGWDVSNGSNFGNMFSDCSALNSVTLGDDCGLLVGELPDGPWYDAEGKEYDRPPVGVAGTFTKAKPATLAVAADGAPDADASLPAQIVEGEQDGLRYVIVPEGASFEYGLEYPELAGRYVGPGVYLTGYAGESDSLVVPLEVAGVPVVSANLSWNDSDRVGMTRLAAVSFERVEGKTSSLAQLDVSGNGLSSLDIEGLDALARLNCEGNPIADLAALQAWAAQDGHEAKLPQVQEAAPADPGDAAAPSEPSAPEQPSEPDVPAVGPSEPSEPWVPAEPEAPSEPAEPEVPSEPETPATPEAPSEPEEPSEEPAPDEAPSGDSAASDEGDLASDSLELGEDPASALAA